MNTTQRYSRKREAILLALRGTTEHPSAETIYTWLKPAHPDLSLGTVYRNLSFFMENGDIISVGTVDGQERYDGNAAPHAHFICKNCGRVIDVDIPDILEARDKSVEDSAGVSVTGHAATFTGLCADCRQRETQ